MSEKSTPKWWDRMRFLEMFRSFLEQWGLWSWIVVAMSFAGAFGMSLWGWLSHNLSAWGIALLFFAIFVAIVVVVDRVHAFLHRRRAIKREASPEETREISERMLQMADQMYEYLAGRTRSLNDLRGHRTDPNDRELWEEEKRHRDETAAVFKQRFGTKMWQFNIELERLGVPTPREFFNPSQTFRPDGVPRFYSMMGACLACHDIVRAIELVEDRRLMWSMLT